MGARAGRDHRQQGSSCPQGVGANRRRAPLSQPRRGHRLPPRREDGQAIMTTHDEPNDDHHRLTQIRELAATFEVKAMLLMQTIANVDAIPDQMERLYAELRAMTASVKKLGNEAETVGGKLLDLLEAFPVGHPLRDEIEPLIKKTISIHELLLLL